MDAKTALLTTCALGALAIGPMGMPDATEAAPVPYVTVPLDTVNASINTAIASINAGAPGFATPVTCSGNTTGTCNGLRFTESVTNLTTGHGNLSATVTVTDSFVTASSQPLCEAVGYGGTGTPEPVNVIANAGNLTFAVLNEDPSAALNATVPVVCLVFN